MAKQKKKKRPPCACGKGPAVVRTWTNDPKDDVYLCIDCSVKQVLGDRSDL
jgi:predicted SprT family Zn-dependent metalloprotease